MASIAGVLTFDEGAIKEREVCEDILAKAELKTHTRKAQSGQFSACDSGNLVTPPPSKMWFNLRLVVRTDGVSNAYVQEELPAVSDYTNQKEWPDRQEPIRGFRRWSSCYRNAEGRAPL